MSIPPVYWTLLGEIALVIIGVLAAVIIVVMKDRKKLKDYSGYLKDTIKKLKKKIKEKEEQESQERALAMLKAIIEHVHSQYQARYGDDIPDKNEEDDKPAVDKFIMIAGYQIMTAQLSAMENSNEPEIAWEKITNELTPLIQNYLNVPKSAVVEAEGSELQEKLDNASQRLQNLEKFKALYFELQEKLSSSVAEIEALNHQLSELSVGSENHEQIMSIIEKNKTHYIEMGQMIGMDNEQHHASVADSMDYSDAIINERKDEIKRLKHQIAQQFEEIWTLQSRLSNNNSDDVNPDDISAGMDTIIRQMKDAEMCIETMDMEIQTLSSELSNAKNRIKELEAEGSGTKGGITEAEKEAMVARFAQESKEMMGCITGLEDSNAEQSKQIKTLEEKLSQLETEYASMEAKYLQAVK
jgi:Sec-independent protein translocase protein TatA